MISPSPPRQTSGRQHRSRNDPGDQVLWDRSRPPRTRATLRITTRMTTRLTRLARNSSRPERTDPVHCRRQPPVHHCQIRFPDLLQPSRCPTRSAKTVPETPDVDRPRSTAPRRYSGGDTRGRVERRLCLLVRTLGVRGCAVVLGWERAGVRGAPGGAVRSCCECCGRDHQAGDEKGEHRDDGEGETKGCGRCDLTD